MNTPLPRYYIDFRAGVICVVDRKTNKVRVNCPEGGVREALAHIRGLNKK